ncbi:MAG: alkaline phosphatase family protein, partial [Thermoplasmatota archaeon]
MSHKKRPKVFILGLDGADWKIIDHMISIGKMPALASIKKNGAWGPLESTKPPITCPAWLTFGTGKNPGKLGVFFFLVREGFKYSTVPFYFKRDVQGDNFWDLLSREGFKVGVVNIPTVHRPYPINGFIIAGFMSKSRRDWLDEDEGESLTYPEELGKEITEEIGKYHVSFPKTTSSKSHLLTLEEEIDEYEEVALQRAKALEHLMANKEWDLITVDVMATDRIGHSMAQLIYPGGGKYDTKQGFRMRERIERFYSKIDSIVSRLREAAGKNTYFFIISDHGMGPQKGKFNANDWLIKRGYLRLKEKSGKPNKKTPSSFKVRTLRRLSRISRAI